ncbi:protein jim lovell-like isoform X2 [Diachasmimorpha longicaudata]|uniref:protein jim lovell-like isoform X2 n=1 Tax=Diachasmimorpha longicaudata TaxID=58733 RepID=UPI0030B91567
MDNQICLKWNSFLNNIATSFESLWEEEGLVDVTLASDGQCLTAHKVILSASSPFFKKVFQANPCQHPVIILQDVHFTELEALLIFIYKGEVNIEEKKLSALLKAAETLQIRGLSEKVIQNAGEEVPKRKKKKVDKGNDSSILETALTPKRPRSMSMSDTSSSEKSNKDMDMDHLTANAVYDPLEMKIEPFEVNLEDLEKTDTEDVERNRLDPTSPNDTQGTSSMPSVTVIPEASENLARFSKRYTNDEEVIQGTRMISENVETITVDCEDKIDCNPGKSHPTAFSSFSIPENSYYTDNSHVDKANAGYPPFPCPFCDRAYTSWGFRRRHIKAVHTSSPKLNCKWCAEILPNHAAWKTHVISCHNLSASDAHNGLLILEEAHMVLQIAHPTKLDTLVNIIKQSSHQTSRQPPD